MLPNFLLPEAVIREDGAGPVFDLGPSHGELVLITLGISRILEQESLDLSIWGSPDQNDWGAKPLAAFPQKFYCGSYQLIIDLASRPEVRFLRANWKVGRWGHGETKPLFEVYVFAEKTQPRVMAKTA